MSIISGFQQIQIHRNRRPYKRQPKFSYLHLFATRWTKSEYLAACSSEEQTKIIAVKRENRRKNAKKSLNSEVKIQINHEWINIHFRSQLDNKLVGDNQHIWFAQHLYIRHEHGATHSNESHEKTNFAHKIIKFASRVLEHPHLHTIITSERKAVEDGGSWIR